MWQKSTSKYYKDGYLDIFNVIGLLVRTVLIHVALLCYYYVLLAIETAKVDLAFSAAIFAIASLFSTLVFRICFGETLLKKHFLGMVMIAFALLIILNYQLASYDFTLIMLVMLNSLVLTYIAYSCRYWMIRGGLQSSDL